MKKTAIVLMIIGLLFTYNIARADIKFIPKEGKLWVKASGELVALKSEQPKEERFALKLEDGQLYILSGEFSNGLKKLVGKKVEINGLLRERIEFLPAGKAGDKELIPSIEVKSAKEIK